MKPMGRIAIDSINVFRADLIEVSVEPGTLLVLKCLMYDSIYYAKALALKTMTGNLECRRHSPLETNFASASCMNLSPLLSFFSFIRYTITTSIVVSTATTTMIGA